MISLAAILEMPAYRIDKSNRAKLEKGVIHILRKVRPDWPREEIILRHFTEGFSNIIYGGHVGDKKEMVLVKVYGTEGEDKNREILMLRLLAARHFGSRLFASFANGHAYEHAPGVTLSYELCIEPKMYPVVAKRIGEMHLAMRQHMPLFRLGHPSSTPSSFPSSNVFETLRQWLVQVPVRLADPDAHARMKQELPSKTLLEKELNELETLLDRPEEYALLLCHGDLSPSNIIYDPLRRGVTFIDLEMCGTNYQAFELASHFMTFAGGDLGRVGRNEFVPAREFQMRWCHCYLTGYKGLAPDRVDPRDVERLWVAVQKFSLVFCLQEIIWALVRAENLTIPGFDILQYGALRFRQYHRNKHHIVQMQPTTTS